MERLISLKCLKRCFAQMKTRGLRVFIYHDGTADPVTYSLFLLDPNAIPYIERALEEYEAKELTDE